MTKHTGTRICKNCELLKYAVVAIFPNGKCRDCGKQLLPVFSSPQEQPKDISVPKSQEAESTPKPTPTNPKEGWEDGIRRILQGNYGCSRVWEAWQYGTMHEDDFYPLEECDEIIENFSNLIRSLLKWQKQELRGKIGKMKRRLKRKDLPFNMKMNNNSKAFKDCFPASAGYNMAIDNVLALLEDTK